MTGFGAASVKSDLGSVAIEVRSVNNRFCDVSLRLPRELNALETDWRTAIGRRLTRGKIDIFVRWQPAPEAAARELNEALIIGFHARWEAMRERRPTLPELDARSLLGLPGAFDTSSDDSIGDALAALAQLALEEALTSLESTRSQEGERLRIDILERAAGVRRVADGIDALRDDVVRRYRQRLLDRWEVISSETGVEVDAGRLEAEAMSLADKSDVTEELVRLRAHLDALMQLMDDQRSEPCGKPLDFLLQEFFREINTIGSKARDPEVTALVLEAKHELEKMREQAQNLV